MSHQGRMLPFKIISFLVDESPYGTRGQAGNMMDWTGSYWFKEWNQIALKNGDLLPEVQDPDVPTDRGFRGGGWAHNAWRLDITMKQRIVIIFLALGLEGLCK